MSRPTIICHMITSLDGRLLPNRWPVDDETVRDLYDSIGDGLESQGWIVGRETLASELPVGEPDLLSEPTPRKNRPATEAGAPLAICFDRRGRLRPESGDLEGDHLVLVLSESVSDTHVDWLTSRGVSVVFSGPDGEDLAGALERIAKEFSVNRLLLEGGGTLNGAFLAAGLIDETSTLVYPVLDGQNDVPSIYARTGNIVPRALELIASETLAEGTVWLRHRVPSG